jgi:chromosome partitioning protein
MTRSIAFHSYKGGTGKTTLACNFAALLAKRGYRVCLLDLDVYAPSLHTYFEKEPKKVINDFLSSTAEVEDVMHDLTYVVGDNAREFESPKASSSSPPSLSKPSSSSSTSETGKSTKIGGLWVGFSNPKKEAIYKLEIAASAMKRDILRRFILFREKLMATYDADYIVIDTSPGIRYWSLNSLAISDIILLTLKTGDIDIGGTKRIAEEIYSSLTKTGTKSLLVCNRVAGYCVPKTTTSNSTEDKNAARPMASFGSVEHEVGNAAMIQQIPTDPTSATLSKEVGIRIISSIPCYCDIQFARKEFLTVINEPQHPFAKQIEQLAGSL